MDQKLWTFISSLAILACLAGCQPALGATPTGTTNQGAGFAGPSGARGTPNAAMMTEMASNPDLQTRIASGPGAGGFGQGNFTPGGFGQARQTATATTEPKASKTPQPTLTPTSPADLAMQAAQDYFAALQKADFGAASKLVSAFSLRTGNITAGDVAAALTAQQAQGAAWSSLEVLGSQAFNSDTFLVHVRYQMTTRDAQTGQSVETTLDEQWPFRLENGKWLYNWTNLIDFKSLGGEAKLANGLTIKPLQMTRYADKIRLTLLVQNGTGEAIVIGTGNQRLGIFHFGDQTVESTPQRYILDAWRSYTDVTVDAQGLYASYPDAVELVKSKTSSAPAWFTFGLVD